MVSADNRRLQRRNTLADVGNQVADALGAFCAQEYGITMPVGFRAEHRMLDQIVDTYFSKVAEFKAQHGFGPESRINQTKISALMVETILEFPAIDQLFSFPADLRGSAIEGYSPASFAFRAMCTFLFVEVEKVPEDLELDVKFCLHSRKPVDHDWLCCIAALLYDAYGDKTQTSLD